MDRKYLLNPDFIIVFPDFVEAGDIQKILVFNLKCWQIASIKKCLGNLKAKREHRMTPIFDWLLWLF